MRGRGWSLKEGNAQEKQREMGSIEEVALKSPTTSQQRKLGILMVQESKGKNLKPKKKKKQSSRTQIWRFKCGH